MAKLKEQYRQIKLLLGEEDTNEAGGSLIKPSVHNSSSIFDGEQNQNSPRAAPTTTLKPSPKFKLPLEELKNRNT